MWKLQQPNGRKEINELHVPVNRNIKLIMGSEDVIHDFLCAGFPREDGRGAGPLQYDVVPAVQRPANITFSARSTAERITR